MARKDATEEDDGWVVALVHDAEYDKSDFGGRGTEMVIIDARKFNEGPVARLRLPVYVPFGVHGSWSTTYVAGPPASADMDASAASRAATSTRKMVHLTGDVAATQTVQEGVRREIVWMSILSLFACCMYAASHSF